MIRSDRSGNREAPSGFHYHPHGAVVREMTMAVNKPVGDRARKGAVKKRTQLKSKRDRLDQAQQDLR